jgi:ubiquinone/menaquinone biosynthesis C-methylase UbiE
MNVIHNVLCRSAWWRRTVEERLLPWALRGIEIGDHVLEIGPGFGATTRVLARDAPTLTVVEVNGGLAERLRRALPSPVTVVEGDGTALPFADNFFSAVLCFTMLHHVPSADLQDRLFAHAYRVLRPGGVFAGSDSLPGPVFRLLHVADVMVPVDPARLPDRLRDAGFATVETSTVANRTVRFRAYK